ncbi:DsbA family protein [Paludibacterium sp. B53371]|uniref:DsbA family protein n=1 Tax=Paludibacterium sp. B53371 TaxID=2806263 RepID=UPI001C03FAC8|nr:DsbA family protein [Paludibacterium sp. B53371]
MKLHYIYDPLCGWCYAAAPLIAAAREILPVEAHAGGMMSDENRQPVTPQLRQYVMGHDRRIAAISGQPFGDAYFDGLLTDETAWFDSTPPIAAILAAEQVAGRGLDMLARLQRAHYVEGQRIADLPVLSVLAQEIGLDVPAFDAAQATVDVSGHLAASRQLLARSGGRGFPTLLLEQDDQWSLIDLGDWLGQVAAWRTWLQSQQGAMPAGAKGSGPVCGPDHCEI